MIWEVILVILAVRTPIESPRGPKVSQIRVFSDFRTKKEGVPFGRFLRHRFGTFSFWSLRDTKKGGLGGPSKLDPFFVDSGVCPEDLRRVPVSTAAQFSLLQPAQKGLQNGNQHEAFWAPKSELYLLWGTIWEKLGPKKLHRK